MADVKRCMRACGYSLSKLAFTPKSAVVLALLFFRMKDYYRNLRKFLLDYGETINAFGLMSNLIASAQFYLIAGIGLMLILSDAPFYDQAQQYVLARARKMPWLVGQLLCVLAAAGIFLLALLAMQHLMLWNCLDYGRGWGRAINTLARTSMADGYGIHMPFSRDFMRLWSVRRCFALSMALCWGGYTVCALVMFNINLVTRSKAGLLAAILMLLLDMVMDFGVDVRYYVLSVASLGRLPLLNTGNHPYYPRPALAMSVLWGSFFVNLAAALGIGRRSELSRGAP